MGRDVPDIYTGNTVKKRDRLAFKEFVIDVITDTFINEFTPTSSSLDGELFTVFLGPSDSIEGYRFLSDELQVDNVKDYVDIYLFGVRQPESKYEIELYAYNPQVLPLEPTLIENSSTGAELEIRFIFNESITRVPEDVELIDWNIRGKIKEIK